MVAAVNKNRRKKQQAQIVSFDTEEVEDEFVLVDPLVLKPRSNSNASSASIETKPKPSTIIVVYTPKEISNQRFGWNRTNCLICQLDASLLVHIMTFVFAPDTSTNSKQQQLTITNEQFTSQQTQQPTIDKVEENTENTADEYSASDEEDDFVVPVGEFDTPQSNSVLQTAFNLQLVCQYWNIMVWEDPNHNEVIWKMIFDSVIPHDHPFFIYTSTPPKMENYDTKTSKIIRSCKYAATENPSYKNRCRLYHSYRWESLNTCCKSIGDTSSSFCFTGDDGEFFEASLMKVVLTGSRSIGKTCLQTRYFTPSFFMDGFCENSSNTCPPTLGFDFKSQFVRVFYNRMDLNRTTKGRYTCGVQIWDCSSLNEEPEEICESVFRDMDACILCYAIDDAQSFNDIKNIHLPLLERHIIDRPITNLPKVLVGLRCDKERKISYEEALEFAQIHDMPFVETSSKDVMNCRLPFNYTLFCSKESKATNKFIDYGIESIKKEEFELGALTMFLNADTRPAYKSRWK